MWIPCSAPTPSPASHPKQGKINRKHLSQHLKTTGARSKIATLETDRPGTGHRRQTPRLLRQIAANCTYKKQKTRNKEDPTILK
jgi:hypothetical protein